MLDVDRYYTEDDMIKLDMELSFIPLTYDGMFKGVFKTNLEILKLFILSQLKLDIDPGMCKIELLDTELPKVNKREYQKTVDIYVRIDNVFVNIEINREYFREVEKRNFIFADKLHTMMLERGDDARKLNEKIFVQINLNAIDKLDENKEKLKYGTDKVVTYGINTGKIYDNNKYILVNFLEYYRDLYYNKREKLDNSSLWLVLFTSRTYQEMYNISRELFDEEMREQFVRKVVDMSRNKSIFSRWELEKLNELVEVTKHDNAVKDGIKQGLEEGYYKGTEITTNEFIEKMLKEGLSIEQISRITNKTEDEIMNLKNNI